MVCRAYSRETGLKRHFEAVLQHILQQCVTRAMGVHLWGKFCYSLKTMDDHDKRSDFVHIGNILDNVLKSYRTEADIGQKDVWQLWDAAVGETIAQNARPAAFKGNLLIVHVSNSTWIHQLQFLKNDLISALNTALGQPLLTDIRFKIGPIKQR
ncbi:MAG: DUF721 domain-containing protein [Desulfobacterales bacterium]